jgi:Kinesin motor domain
MEQIFAIAEQRSDRFKDSFALTIVEVFNERLSDLIVGTNYEDQGVVVMASEDRKSSKKKSKEDDASSGKNVRLEIRTDIHGETVVQGLLAVQVSSFEQVCDLWKDCIRNRRQRLVEQGIDPIPYEAASHTIVTLKTVSTNIATGTASYGKIQFVDLGGADLIPRSFDSVVPKPPSQNAFASVTGDSSEWRFANRSLETLHEVVVARSEFTRPVPYRNSTLTHLLMDSLDHDAKVLAFACVSCDPKDAQEAATTLRFASRLSKVSIGHATRHTSSPASASVPTSSSLPPSPNRTPV